MSLVGTRPPTLDSVGMKINIEVVPIAKNAAEED